MNCMVLAAVSRKVMHSAGGVDGGSPGSFPDIPGPTGALSFVVPGWIAQAAADDYLVLYDTVSRATGTRAYAYRKKFTGQATESGTVTGLAAGTYYSAVAAIEDGVMGDLSQEFDPVTAA